MWFAHNLSDIVAVCRPIQTPLFSEAHAVIIAILYRSCCQHWCQITYFVHMRFMKEFALKESRKINPLSVLLCCFSFTVPMKLHPLSWFYYCTHYAVQIAMIIFTYVKGFIIFGIGAPSLGKKMHTVATERLFSSPYRRAHSGEVKYHVI